DPGPTETRERWLERCMGDEEAVADFPDTRQRYAVCNSKWRAREEDSTALAANVKRTLAILAETHPGLPDWAYLIHHLHDHGTDIESVEHCVLLDHLGNLFQVEHLEAEGTTHHVVTGLLDEQDVFWSDEEAKEAGESVPCASRQLPS
ncbi:MAG: hypothetical protein KJ604_19955, partial [Gammaproteobacteria bacterium]|nr:hypothetical protein [Gammaproteobacteria bacterium]